MWADLALSGASSLIQQGVAYSQAKQEEKSKKAWQAYKNSMTKLADANNQNTITSNELSMEDRAANQRFQIRRSEYITSGQAEASAAAAGTGGRSVNMVIFDIERNASMQQGNVTADVEAQYNNFDNQRQNSAFQAASQMDYSTIPSPNLATYALGFASSLTKSYNSLNGTKV